MIQLRKLAPACLAVGLACNGMSASADDYRAEVRLSGRHTSLDGTAPDVEVFGATGTYYLEPMRTDGLPLAEAAFLNRSSFASAFATHFDFDGDDADVFGASLGYYVPNTIFFGRLGVTHVDFGPGNDTNWNGTFGVTPFDGLLLTTDFDEDGWDPNVTAKYVGKLANAHYYAISATAVDPDGGDTDVGVDFDYFLDLTFKVGAGFSTAGDRFTARAEKFFTPRFAVGGEISTAEDDNAIGATVAWRF